MSARAEVVARLAEARTADAVETLRALWAARPTLANAAFVLDVLDGAAADRVPVLARVRVAIERNWTVEPLVPLLRAQARWLGLALDVRVGGFDQCHQALRDRDGPLAAFAPDLVLVALRDHPHAADVGDGVRAFRAVSGAPLLVTDEAPPADEDEARRARRLAHNRALRDALAGLPSVHVLPHEGCCGEPEWRGAHDARADAHHGLPWRAALHPAIAAHWLRWIAPLAGRLAKLVVTDLDDTLWPGVIDEGAPPAFDGPAGADHLRYQRVLLALRERGVLLAVASRNEREHALGVLDGHPALLLRSGHFAALSIDGSDKAAAIVAMADALGVGLDAVAFVDDSPIECERVRRALPAVHVIDPDGGPGARADRLRDCPLVQRPVLTDDDLARADRVREARARDAHLDAHRDAHRDAHEALLASLALRVETLPARLEPARVAQLTVRTNQFNLTGLRLDEAALATLLARDGVHLAFRVADRFGDYGLVGACLGVRAGDALRIEVLVLSCRALGRGVETRMLEAVADAARAAGCRRVVGRYRPSARNGGVADLFARHGYVRLGSADAAVGADGAGGVDAATSRADALWTLALQPPA